LVIGDHSWIGEDVWIDNLAEVEIGSNVCISQGAYLCTGSHDWSRPTFDLVVKPIRIGNGAWIAARAAIRPGVSVGEGAVLGLGGVATSDLAPWTVYQGVPAKPVRKRIVRYGKDCAASEDPKGSSHVSDGVTTVTVGKYPW
jgi:putative colanic acid biosynthesis acetyltransferase WcaF